MATPVLLLRLHAVVVLVVFLFFGYKLLLLLTGRREQLRHLRARTRWADSLLLGSALLTGAAAWAALPMALDGWSLFQPLLTLLLLLFCVRALRREQPFVATWQLLAALVCYGLITYAGLTTPGPHHPNTLRQALLGEAATPTARTTAAAAASSRAEATATPDAVAPVDSTTLSATSLARIDSAQATETASEAAPAAPELVAGQALFVQHCAPCHGTDGRLGRNGAHDLTKSHFTAPGRTILVLNGSINKKMPGFQGKLTDEQVAQVVAYSLTLR